MAAADVQQHRQEVTQQQQHQQHGVVVPKLLLRWDGVVVTARKFSRSLLASCAIDFDTLHGTRGLMILLGACLLWGANW